MSNYDALLRSFGPSAWWKLSDPVGSTSVKDWSGNGYTGTVNGGVTFGQAGPIAGEPQDTAALFDGSTGYVASTYEPTLTDCTLAVWARPTAAGGFLTVPGTIGLWSSTAAISSNTSLFGNGSWVMGYAGPDMYDGNWHFVVGTYDGTSGRVYVDGVLVAGPTAQTALPAPTGGASIEGVSGWYGNTGSGKTAPGTIAQLAIFPTALTAA